jgi:nucleotidyltransferase substrate binding protein (TIGR01987 family)
MINANNINLSTLKNALNRLVEGNERYLKDINDTQIRDGLIKRYEFTYEISHKILKRYLELSSPNPTVFDSMAFSDLIRTGNEQSLLKNDWTKWKIFREMRSKSSHTDDEQIAKEVVSIIPDFIDEAKFLLKKLENINV